MSVKTSKRIPFQNKTIEDWACVIARYHSSGLQQKQFCEREGIAFGSFKTWLYRLRAAEKKVSEGHFPLFTPIVLEEEPRRVTLPQEPQEPIESPLILEIGQDMRLVVSPHFGQETLRRFLEVVRGLHV